MDYIQVGHWGVVPVTTGASTEGFAATLVRDHARASSSEDTVLAEKLAAAKRRIEGRTQRRYFREQFDMVVDRFPADGCPIRLPWMPAVSVQSIWSYDTEGTSSEFGSSGWFVDTYSEPGRVCLRSATCWPSGRRNQVAGIIRFTAGYSTGYSTGGALAGIPDPMLEAVRKLATELYENREAASLGNSVNEPLPYGLEDLLEEFIPVEVF